MPPNRPDARLFSRILDQFVAETLMVAFAMIVRHEFGECTPEVALTQRDQTVQAFLIDRSVSGGFRTPRAAKDEDNACEARAIRDARPPTLRPSWANRQERFDKIPQRISKQPGGHCLFTLPRRRRAGFRRFLLQASLSGCCHLRIHRMNESADITVAVCERLQLAGIVRMAWHVIGAD
jgi:hypothetical protein